MTVIGLTGGIASGKSTAAEYLRGLGATLIDADRVGHRSYEPGTSGFEKVVNAFGHEIVGKDGVIDRRILGGKVFGAPGEMERLNAILWPEIRTLISEELAELKRRDPHQMVILEAAVLIEAGWTDLCDEIWVVTTTPQIALARIMSRNNLSEEAATARIQAQAGSRERALQVANVKIDNSGTQEQFEQRLDRAWKTLTNRLADERGVKRPTRLPVKPVAKPAGKAASKAPASKTPVAKTPVAKAAGKPAPSSKAATKVAPKVAAKPAPKAPVRPAGKPVTKGAAKPAGKPMPKAAATPAAKPATTTAVKPSAKPAATAAAKPVAKPASKPVAKPAAKAATKTAAKTPSRLAASAKTTAKAKAPAKPSRPAAKPAAKAASKPAAKASAKPAGKPAARSAAKPAAKPAAGARRR